MFRAPLHEMAALRALGLLLVPAGLLAACDRGKPTADPVVEAGPARLVALAGPEQLRREFVGAAGQARLILFMSPT